MQNNFYDYNQIGKKPNTILINQRNNSNKFNQIPKQPNEDENNLFTKKTRKFEDNNSTKRYLTPLALRYQDQNFDKIQNNNYSKITKNNTNNSNNITNDNNNNDTFYYKNLYQQTKNNLNKEKQKNEENLIINNNLNQENNMLKDKINSLTKQLDRLIDLVEKSNTQNIKNISIKQEQINKLNNQIELLKKNDTLEKRRSKEEIESMANTIRQLNSNNQNTQLIIKTYENKIEQMTQMYNNEINNLKEQIISLNKNLTLSVNEKNGNELKFKEIIAEMNQKLKSQYDVSKMLNIKNIENSKLLNELNEYKNNYNEIKLKY